MTNSTIKNTVYSKKKENNHYWLSMRLPNDK